MTGEGTMNFIGHWKTTVAGVILIGAAVCHSFFGIDIPGFTMDLGTSITMGLGLIVATDASK